MPHKNLECPFNEEQAIDVIQSLVDTFGYKFVNKYAAMRREDNYAEELYKIKLDMASRIPGKISKFYRRVELSD